MICEGCGKPLSAEELRGDDCPYCGMALPYRAEAIKDTATVKELLRDADGDGIPDIFQGPGREKDAEEASGLQKQPLSDGAIALLITAFVAFMILLGVFYEKGYLTDDDPTVTYQTTGTPAASTQQNPPPVNVKKNRHISKICIVDANSDGVDDIAVSVYENEPYFQIVDGSTGQALWTGETVKKTTQLGCIDKRWFAAYAENFDFTLYDAVDKTAVFSATGSDVADKFAKGKDCIQIKTADKKLQGYRLANGEKITCRTTSKMKRLRPNRVGLLSLTAKKTEITLDGTRYELSVRKRGTKMLRLLVSKGGKKRIDRELPYQKPTFSAGIAAGKGMVMVFGATKEDKKKGVLIGIDAESGEERYSVSMGDNNHPTFMHFNGEHVLLKHGVNLYAHDIETGELKWVLTD